MNEDYLLKYYILLFFSDSQAKKRNKKKKTRKSCFSKSPVSLFFSTFSLLFFSLLFPPISPVEELEFRRDSQIQLKIPYRKIHKTDRVISCSLSG